MQTEIDWILNYKHGALVSVEIYASQTLIVREDAEQTKAWHLPQQLTFSFFKDII